MATFSPTSPPGTPTLYVIPGSPSSWRVWLALRALAVPLRVERLSFNAGDTRRPEYRALNPRGQVPVLVDGDLVLSESFAILEYLGDVYGARDAGRSVWPADVGHRARARRIAHAIDGNLGARVYRPLADQLFLAEESNRDMSAVARAVEVGRREVAWLEAELGQGPFPAGNLPSAADFTAYGLLAFLAHIERHHRATVDLVGTQGEPLRRWAERVQALPYFAETWPAHWPPAEVAWSSGSPRQG